MTRPPLPPSLWAATAQTAPQTPPLTEVVEADVCVIGGGFTGLSAALHLAEAGTNVVLVEAAEPGFGASGRNGGQVIPGFKLDPDALIRRFGEAKGEAMARYAGGTADFVFDLIKKHDIDCDATRAGWLHGIHNQEALRAAERRCEQWGRRGAPVSMLGREETERLSGTKGYLAALSDNRGGSLNPLGYARGIAKAAIKAGASLHGASPATAVDKEGKSWRVSTPEGSVLAEQVLVCTNAYTDDFWPGLKQSVVPVYSYQIATRPLSDNLRASIMPEGHALSDTRRLLTYCRVDPYGRLVVGGRGEFRESSDPKDYQNVVIALRRMFPHIEEEAFEFYWGGKVAMTASKLPHFAELAPGVTAAMGFNGRGVGMAGATGAQLAKRALGTPFEDLPLPNAPIKAIPFHRWRAPFLQALVSWYRFLDKRDDRRV